MRGSLDIRQRLLALILVFTSLVCGCTGDGSDNDDRPRTGAGRLVGADTGLRYLSPTEGDEAFARAVVPRPFEFPQDHGSHDEYRSEWWYFTGNLETAEGRHFGFELTFFRLALSGRAPAGAERGSEWATNQAWMAHFALTDTRTREFVAAERFARGALGLAGAEAAPFKVWVEDWSAEAARFAGVDGRASTGSDGVPADEPAFDSDPNRIAARLSAGDGDYAIDIDVVAAKAPIANGENGLDRKGSGAGNASYYYSITRLDAEGTVTTPDGQFAVEGSAWLDREWGTSALEDGAVGWDWFALQLDDGRDLMVYRLRRADGSSSPYSGGSLVDADGSRRELSVDDVRLEATGHWTSKASGVRYPVAWRLVIPSEDLVLDVRPVLEQQELALTVRYWEGAVRARGSSQGQPVAGKGYLELAGY